MLPAVQLPQFGKVLISSELTENLTLNSPRPLRFRKAILLNISTVVSLNSGRKKSQGVPPNKLKYARIYLLLLQFALAKTI